MNPDVKKKKVKSIPKTKTTKSAHVLIDPEEWKDHDGQRVIAEYHKKDLLASQVENEMQDETNDEKKSSDTETTGDSSEQRLRISRILDISTVEVITYAFFRAMFGKGIRVPLKLKGVIDMDIAVENNDVILNTNDVSFIPPQLQIWRFIFTYKNKPIIEYGRGIKRGMKVHYGRALIFLLAMWSGGRKTRKAQVKAAKIAELEKTRNSEGKNKTNKKKGTDSDDR
ncbi:MAG: hypothetical protein IMZ53_08680 [Thermoplasmata archaeon]|nr:hypothetical protein [Thermoplasmata archaeon]MBE3140644.1 hypothetical protein [Thermoplasmata archaeon]